MKKAFHLLNVLIFIFFNVLKILLESSEGFQSSEQHGSPNIAKAQATEAEIVFGQFSKKSLHLKSKTNELGKPGFDSYPFCTLPVPLGKNNLTSL